MRIFFWFLGSKEAVLQELAQAANEDRRGFVAVLDADFDRIIGPLNHHPAVVWTDVHDLEALLIASPALKKVLDAVASEEKLKTFAAEHKVTVREALLQRGAALGELRWLSRQEKLDLTFRKKDSDGFRYLPYETFCDRHTWELNREALVRTVLNFSSRQDLRVADLLARLRAPTEDLFDLCVGHDLVGLLMIGLRKKLGSKNHSIEGLQEMLRLAFERPHLEQTAMYRGLRAWEQANVPFRVF